ncbi:MAG: cytochrome B, partial [Gammaproteobacteria bacterium]|nr:cytochrome B [Gammaproteobacteria bacterium]
AATVAIVLLLAAVIVLAYEHLEVEPVPDLPTIQPPGEQKIQPAQKAAIPLFAISSGLFAIQTFAGGYIANAFASREDFYGLFQMLGLQRAVLLPFTAMRAIHVDLGVLWVIGMWMAAALFVAPFLEGTERPWLKNITRLLVVVIAVSVLGSLIGLYLAIRNVLGESWFWLGTEGMEYVDMGRLWKLGITAAFALWIALMVGWYGRIMKQKVGHIQRILVGIGVGISAAFLPSLAFLPASHFVLADFWRWWTVHLWVEGIFAFFQVAAIGVVFLNLNLVTREMVTKSIYLEGILVVVAGSFAIGHHYWWIGEPSFWISIGSIFSTLEVVPLFMLLVHAFDTYRKMDTNSKPQYHRIALLFLIASAVWQFLGSGVLGLILNFPIINYYEHGTYLTVAHAHGSFLGGFGFLAIGLMLYSLRFTVSEANWPRRAFTWSFYLLNAGLFLMLVVSVTPVGLIQIFEAFSNTYHASRELAFYQQPIVTRLMELRMPGDTLVLLGAVLLFLNTTKTVLISRAI